MAVEVTEITTRYKKSGHLPAFMYRNLLFLCQFFVAGAAASGFAGSFFEQQGFLTSFLQSIALGQSFFMSAMALGQSFFMSAMALGQSFFMSAMALGQSFFMSAMTLGQSFFMAALSAQQGFLQSFLQFGFC